MKLTQEQYDEKRAAIQASIAASRAGRRPVGVTKSPVKRSKYRNIKTVVDGITFDSKREAGAYRALMLRVAAGELKTVLAQVSVKIGKSKRRLRLDFVAVYPDDRCEFIDAKGMATDAWKIKRDEFEANHNIKIRTV